MEVRVLSDVYDVFGWDREDRSSIYAKTLENIESRLKSRLPENDEVELTALLEACVESQGVLRRLVGF